jgi:2-(1,2-epoxy-1,2-dihydrophenyl)acetyl-CoA isomerase
MDQEEILFTKSEGVGTITLNRPHRKNAFTVPMLEKWAQTLQSWRTDPEVRVIVVTGTGDAFCSGVDWEATASDQDVGPYEYKQFLWEKVHRIPLTLEDLDKPVIAAINGVAVGAGLDMALMCDLRFAASTARLSEGYIRVGLVPGDGGAYYLPRLVGIAKALELIWTGDFIDAQEAHRIGMVNRVYPPERLMEETLNFAGRLAQGPTSVIRMVKRAVYQSARVDLRTALDLISSHMGVIRYSEDSQRTMREYMERLFDKRKGGRKG